MKIDLVDYYYKDLKTQVEMDFTLSEEYGWGICKARLGINCGGKDEV